MCAWFVVAARKRERHIEQKKRRENSLFIVQQPRSPVKKGPVPGKTRKHLSQSAPEPERVTVRGQLPLEGWIFRSLGTVVPAALVVDVKKKRESGD